MSEAIDYSGYEDKAAPTPDAAARLAALAEEQEQAELAVARAEENLTKAQDVLRDVAEYRIPQLMDELKLARFETTDGLCIDVSEKIRASIPKAREGEAFKYLEDTQNDDIVTRQVTVDFSSQEKSHFKMFLEELAQRNDPLRYKTKKSVHPSALAAFVRQQLSDGLPLPQDVFGVFRQRVSSITRKGRSIA